MSERDDGPALECRYLESDYGLGIDICRNPACHGCGQPVIPEERCNERACRHFDVEDQS